MHYPSLCQLISNMLVVPRAMQINLCSPQLLPSHAWNEFLSATPENASGAVLLIFNSILLVATVTYFPTSYRARRWFHGRYPVV